MSSVLEVRDLRVTFSTPLGELQAVRGVELSVAAGESLGVVGESGSGKSVTFLAALGLLPRSARVEGSIRVGGTEVVGASNSDLRRIRGADIAMIFQDPLSSLNPVIRVGDQIVEMIRAHDSATKAVAWRRAEELLDLVGIPQPKTRARQFPHEFSGGMRQRVVIAMAIANSPKVLIADEPTTALDVTVQAQILEVIQRIQSQMGMAVVLITHDLGVVARVCERVQVMYAGRVVERGPVDEIFDAARHPYTRGLLSSLPHDGLDRLRPIPGFPPNMLAPPAGCAFRPRCEHADPVCAAAVPVLRPDGGVDHACVRMEAIASGGAV